MNIKDKTYSFSMGDSRADLKQNIKAIIDMVSDIRKDLMYLEGLIKGHDHTARETPMAVGDVYTNVDEVISALVSHLKIRLQSNPRVTFYKE